jgi:reversibly glycosylated polypeptide/UDP-arabinopyranose mutase
MLAVVVPTIRPESFKKFADAWEPLLNKYNVHFIKVEDGDKPMANFLSVKDIMGKDADLIYNKTDGVRNLGFAFVAKYLPNVDTIITLDDDTLPIGDTIKDHLDTLNKRVPINWISTASEYMRGFPYGVREEAEVVLSHGVWEGVADWDAPTQLVNGNKPVEFYKGPIPKGIYYPMCAMNVAFKRKMLPYMCQAPGGPVAGMYRFTDIWCGINSKREIDKRGWAVYTGGARVRHERASNVWKSLRGESLFIEENETYWKGDEKHPYFRLYNSYRKRWEKFIKEYL